MVTLASDLNFFAPRIFANLTAILLPGCNFTSTWDMRTLCFFFNGHFQSLLFSIPHSSFGDE